MFANMCYQYFTNTVALPRLCAFLFLPRISSKCIAAKLNRKISLTHYSKASRLPKRAKKNDNIYIKDTKTAESIASFLCEDWNSGYILEANPGPGILSKAILKEKKDLHLRVFEKDEEFLSNLKKLCLTYQNLEVISEDILRLPKLDAKLLMDGTKRIDTFFKDIPECSWEDKVPCRLFAIIYNDRSIKFLRYLLLKLASRSSIFSLGRCELFLLVPESEYLYMTAKPKVKLAEYRDLTVLYNIFFDMNFKMNDEDKLLQKYSSDIFQPLPTLRKKKGHEFYLVKLTPKPDLFSNVVNNNEVPEFYEFVTQHMAKRTALVIKTMDLTVPFCGPRLIKEGMCVYTKFGHLKPEQILWLFNQFSSWPEYKFSGFYTELQKCHEETTRGKETI